MSSNVKKSVTAYIADRRGLPWRRNLLFCRTSATKDFFLALRFHFSRVEHRMQHVRGDSATVADLIVICDFFFRAGIAWSTFAVPVLRVVAITQTVFEKNTKLCQADYHFRSRRNSPSI